MRNVLIGLAFATAACSASAQQEAAPKSGQRAVAVFAGGCFWCTEADFDKVPGVLSTTSGYTGGRVADPTYEQVSGGDTGHIEAVRITYDPSRVAYPALVDHFFRTIDPLDAGGQFCDRGSQYRSAIFVEGDAQRVAALRAKAETARALDKRIATDILPAARFYPAEAYHQDYYKKNPVKYRFYRTTCGRDARINEVWGDAAR